MPISTKDTPTQSELVAFDKDKVYRLVFEIVGESDVRRLKVNIDTLVSYIESVDKKHKPWICNHFTKTLLNYVIPYIAGSMDTKDGHNYFIASTNHSPTVLMFISIPSTTKTKPVIDGLKKFSARCDEFIEPIETIITEEEISETINVAQNTFRIMEIIAPKEYKLKILRFNYSHIKHNAECAIPDNSRYCNALLLYHSRNLESSPEMTNRVLVFAHELGHALHLALTGDITILPDGFDKFNENLGISFPTPESKREAFADITALAIVASKPDQRYLPSDCKDRPIIPIIINYLKKVTALWK